MDKKETHIKMAEELEKFETGLAVLYSYYADQNPDYKQFWTELATDERTHAMMLKTFRSLIAEDKLIYAERKFSLRAIEENYQLLSAHLSFVKRNKVLIREALANAMQFENLMLEKKTFEVQEGDSEELKRTLSALMEDTQRHFEKIQKLYNALGHP